MDTDRPAFPRSKQVIQGMPTIDEGEHGMSLRDYFAAKAMPKIIRDGQSMSKLDCDLIAKYSYIMADAMIEKGENTYVYYTEVLD